MYKLVILIEPPEDLEAFEARWPEFLHLSEAMPELRREATSRVDRLLYGRMQVAQMHELFFDDAAAAHAALASSTGQEAGRLLQQISGGRMLLFFADHKEDELANILRYKQGDDGLS